MGMDWKEWQRKRENKQSSAGNTPIADAGEVFNILKNILRGKNFLIIIAIIILAWLATGFFTIQPYENGVVKRFGAFNRLVGSGLNYHLPYPMESVLKPNVTQIMQFDIATTASRINYALSSSSNSSGGISMLTGDENFVDIDVMIYYRIDDPKKYVFNVFKPDQAIRDAAESAIREVIGRNKLKAILTEARQELQDDTLKTLKAMMEKYDTGLLVTNVEFLKVLPPLDVQKDFKDVASAREDKNRSINQAQEYANEILPQAQGEAAAVEAAAKSYAAIRTQQAEGETKKFIVLLEEYRKSPQTTKNRLFFETIDQVIKPAEKFIISGKTGNNLLPHLGLQQPALRNINNPAPVETN